MVVQCEYCAGLSIDRLVELAELADKEYSELQYSFSKRGFYQHHKSLDDLEVWAGKGCSFCQLMLECFKNFTQTSSIYAKSPITWNESSCGGDNSLYALAKNSPQSDIKVCIWASHVFDWDPLDLVRVFDLIVVQIGATEDPTSFLGIDDVLKPLPLVLKTARGRPVYLRNYRIGRFELDPDLGSQENCAIAKGWLKTCQKQHPSCPANLVPALPTRVIDVGPAESPHDAILVHGKGRKGEYVALSHCWGGPITPVLDNNTLEPFQRRIPYNALPSNFRDAITITRQLGIRYLWIDSLCILQDSKQDWQKESKVMGSIYRNSMVMVSGSASRGSTEGILKSEPSFQGPHPFYMRLLPGDIEQAEVKIEIMVSDEESLSTLDAEGPLASRGWTLQESALPPRQILYGKRGLFWKCPQGFECAEGLPPGGPRTPSARYSTATSALLPGLRVNAHSSIGNDTLQADYYKLVMIYSRRRLTVDGDKLPAFSALAQSLHTVFGGEYIAGLWTTDLNQGLTWRSLRSTCKHVSTYRAPSWSWAVTNDQILYPSRPSRTSPLDLQLIKFDIRSSDPSNPYGEICFGELIVSGRIRRLARSSQIINMSSSDRSRGSVHYDDVEVAGQSIDLRMCSLFLVPDSDGSDDDYLISVGKKDGQEETWEIDPDLISSDDHVLLLINFGGLEDDGDRDTIFTAADFLALRLLRNIDGVPTYERVGFAYLDSSNTEWIRSWKTETLRLV